MNLAFLVAQSQEVFVKAEQDLSFGKFYVKENTAGTITIQDDGSWHADSNVYHLDQLPQAAVFTVWTDSWLLIRVQVEVYRNKLHGEQGYLNYSDTESVSTYRYVIDRHSPLQINVGGSIKIEPNEGVAPGTYVGDVTVTAKRIPFFG